MPARARPAGRLLDPPSHDLQSHLHRFASEGLRTLVLAQKVLTPEQAQAWLATYQEAAVSLVQREERLEAAAYALEVRTSPFVRVRHAVLTALAVRAVAGGRHRH